MYRGGFLAVAGFLVVFATNCLALTEDEYLKYIDTEASKLSGSSEAPAPAAEAADAPRKKGDLVTSQKAFEKLLKAKARGTYSFYESLMEKDKAEVFKTYTGGASMRQIRRMIIDRKMNR